ncbi:MAG: hypothetical protein H7X88_11535, partial [Gloeobacteraceae cyanobacterium ES-bin-316]|nr:hypothetical protein [Ferruginibacter sp.]
GDFIYAGTATSSLVLPVTLGSFNISSVGKSVNVDWSTENESNTNYFAIERSQDGQRFVEIGRKLAAGNSSSPRSYRFTDNAPGLQNTTVFYRITTVDLDEKRTLSPVKRIGLSGVAGFVSSIVPNPVKPGDEIRFTIESEKKQQASYSFIAADGKVLKTSRIMVLAGANIYSAVVPFDWSDAVIYVSFVMDGKKQRIPLLLAK